MKALPMSVNAEDLATEQDVAALWTDFRAELHLQLNQPHRVFVAWMFGLLTAFTALVWSVVAIALVVNS